MDLLGFDLNLADMDERFPILVQYGIYNRDLMPYKSDDFNQLIFVMGGTAEYCSDSETHDVKRERFVSLVKALFIISGIANS